jgi:hypothetical protein
LRIKSKPFLVPALDRCYIVDPYEQPKTVQYAYFNQNLPDKWLFEAGKCMQHKKMAATGGVKKDRIL